LAASALPTLGPFFQQEGNVRIFAKKHLALIACATALTAVPAMTLGKAEASSSKHIKKHGRINQWGPGPGSNHPWPADQAWRVARPPNQTGPACPGLARSFECRTWPPPFDEDPDRKASGADAGN